MGELVTGEAVVLDVPCARFPSRLLALAIDLLIQVIALVVLLVVIGVAAGQGGLNAAWGAAAAVTAMVVAVVGYPVIWETLTGGRSPGKFALGLRVVSDDGGPERFRQALVRGLAGAVEIWGLAGAPALICSLLSGRGKRLGDVFAGTFVIQQRLPSARGTAPPLSVAPHLAAWAAGLEMSGLTDQTAEVARSYLARVRELAPVARDRLGQRIAATVSTQVTPPPPAGTPVVAYLAAVLAERRRREDDRFARLGGRPAYLDGQAAGPSAGTTTAPSPPSPAVATPARQAPGPAPVSPAPQAGTWETGRVEAPWRGEGSSAPGPAPRSGRASGHPETPGGFVPPA